MPAWCTWSPFNNSRNMWHIPGEIIPLREEPKKPEEPKKKLKKKLKKKKS